MNIVVVALVSWAVLSLAAATLLAVVLHSSAPHRRSPRDGAVFVPLDDAGRAGGRPQERADAPERLVAAASSPW